MPKPVKPLTRPCRLEGGRLYWSDGTEGHERTQRKLLAAAMKHLPDGPYEFELRPWVETRRARANAFYWKFLTEWSRENGHTKDELHEIEKMRHCSRIVETVDPATGEVTEMRIARSTAMLSIAEFSEYLDRVMCDAAEVDGFVMQPTQSEDWRDGRKGRAA